MKKFALVFFSVFLFVSAPFAAHANIVTATGKYLINTVKHIKGGAKVEATNVATGAKHAVTHGVSSADLGKSIGAGIVGIGVASGVGLAFQAITGLALDAVDWVLDPANNRVVYVESGTGYIYTIVSYDGSLNVSAPDFTSVCNKAMAAFITIQSTSGNTYTTSNMKASPTLCTFDYHVKQYTYTERLTVTKTEVVEEPKYLPIDTVAAKVISNAEAGNAAAQKDVETHVAHKAQNGDLDNELDNATDITQPENPEEPNPDEPQQCPSGTVKLDNVCVKIPDSDSDEPLFCDSSEFTKKVCDWIDWTQAEPEEVTPEQIDIKEVEADNSNKIDMSGECPAPYQLNFSISGYAQNHSISYEPLCNALILLKPIFVGSGALSGMFILMGYSRPSGTGAN